VWYYRFEDHKLTKLTVCCVHTGVSSVEIKTELIAMIPWSVHMMTCPVLVWWYLCFILCIHLPRHNTGLKYSSPDLDWSLDLRPFCYAWEFRSFYNSTYYTVTQKTCLRNLLHPVFLQAGCPSCRPTNIIGAMQFGFIPGKVTIDAIFSSALWCQPSTP